MRPVRIGTTARSRGIRTRALALIAAVALLTLSLSAGVASADGGRHQGDAENTFTKWVAGYPHMAGVVGGDVGDGTFAGEVLTRTATSTSVVVDAFYHFTGSRHSFTALVHVVQTGVTTNSTAVITGHVTDGWMNGNLVEGEYTQTTCAHDGISTTCFQGTLDILRGSETLSSARSGELHVTKECSEFTGGPGSFCTITSSNIRAIEAGARVVYASPPGATSLDSDVVLVAGPGNTAVGHCYLNFLTNLGLCTFSGGTGKFTWFHASVVVTDHPDTGWTAWDGTYSFAPAD